MKKLCTCMTTALLLCTAARAQTWDWAQKLEASGTTEVVVVKGIDVDGSDNSYVTGYYKGTVNGVTSNDTDAFVAKFSPTGALQWFYNGGGGSSDGANAISVETYGSGALYITGYMHTKKTFWNVTFYGNGDTMTIPATCSYATAGARPKQGFIAKYSLAGDLLWVRPIYTTNTTLDAEGLAITSTYHHLNGAGMERNLFVTGYFQKGALYLQKTGCDSLRIAPGTSSGYQVAFVAKFLGSNGNAVWGKSFGIDGETGEDMSIGKGISFDAAAALGYITNGGLYVTGDFREQVNVSGTSLTHAAPDMAGYLAHLNPSNGNLLWAKKIESASGSDVVMRNLTFKEGNLDRLYALGEYTGTSIKYDGGTAVSSGGGRDIFLLQVAKTNGAQTTLISDGGSGDQYAYGMDMVNWGNSGVDDNIYISGGFDANVNFSGVTGFSGTTDQYMAKYDWNLNFICAAKWDAGYRVGTYTIDINDAAASKTNGTGFYGGLFRNGESPVFTGTTLSTTTAGAGYVSHWACCDCPPPTIDSIKRTGFASTALVYVSYPPCDNLAGRVYTLQYRPLSGGTAPAIPFTGGTNPISVSGLIGTFYIWNTINNCGVQSPITTARKAYAAEGGLNFRLMPNPADEQLSLQSDHTGTAQLYNMLGQRMLTLRLDGPSPVVVDVSGFAAGNYICEFRTEQGDVVTERFVVQH